MSRYGSVRRTGGSVALRPVQATCRYSCRPRRRTCGVSAGDGTIDLDWDALGQAYYWVSGAT
jgi:hypothetical protein